MKRTRITMPLLLGLLLVTTSRAQSSAIAVVDTEAFAREVGGITRIIRAQQDIDAEFAHRKDALNKLQARLARLSSPSVPIPVYPSDDDRRQGDVETLKEQVERQTGELNELYNQRLREVLGPVMAEVEKHLETYARREGATLLVDRSRTACSTAPCRWEAAGVRDITEEFIREHNRLRP